MINLLNNPTYDNTRNELNAQLFVNNLKNTLKAFEFNPKVSYEVYRNITIYDVKITGDKTYSELKEYKAEIALALGLQKEELKILKINDNEAEIKVPNMKKNILSLKELLIDFEKDNNFKIPLGLDEEDKIVTFDFDNDGSLLVTGVTGIGKTNLFRNIIMNILINYKKEKIIILDSQGINYNDFKDVCEVITKKDLIISRIKEIRKEFEDRIKNNEQREKIILLIDEIYEIIKISNSVDEDINYLVQEGNKANINVIVSTDSILDEDIKRIFTNKKVTKLSFYLTSKDEYNLFLSKTVKESLYNDGMYLETKEGLTRISVPLIEDNEIEKIINKINKK